MKNFKFLLLFIWLQIVVVHISKGSEDSTKVCYNCCRPDGHAPAGIMTDCIHPKGEFVISYSYMNMAMQGNQSGTKSISDGQIYKTYMMSMANMNMQMHMLMFMYGITNKLTAMAMVNYNVNTMSMHMMPMQSMMMNMPGMSMTDYSKMPTSSKSAGFSDTKLYLLYNLLNSCSQRLVLGAGLSLPTGSISAKGATLQSNNDVLPYNMQLGTGTYNLLPSLVYVNQASNLSWGAAFNGNIKLGVNSRNYCLGNEYGVSPWLAYKFVNWISVSARAEAYTMAKMYGYDKQINQSSLNDPTANVTNYGGQKINAYLGLNLYAPKKFLKGSRLLFEYGIPAYQNVNGLQMTVKSILTARLQIALN